MNEDLELILRKYLYMPLTEATKHSIKQEVRNYLDNLLYEKKIESYGEIVIKSHEDGLHINVTPKLIYKPYSVKHIYTGETIIKPKFTIENGRIYSITYNGETNRPISMVFDNGFKIENIGVIGCYFRGLLESGVFVEISSYRDGRIDEILND